MKKAISIILLCISVFSFCIPPISAAPAYVHGDVDRDGVLTIVDATYIQRVVASMDINDYDELAADYNTDNETDILDATMIQCRLADIETSPINGYTQLNNSMKAYLDEVDYTDMSYQFSMLSHYIVNTTTKYHKPEGYTFSIPHNGRMLYLYSAESCAEFPVQQGSFTIYQLIPGTEYTFLIVDDDGNHLDAGIITPEPGVRIINTQKTANVRDLGGWKCDGGTIKYGKIYRGGEIREEDVALLRDTLGIRAQLNLRWDSELEYDVSPLGSDIDYRHINGPNYNLGKGSRWSDDAHKQILDTVMDNAIAGVPLYFHCGAGADRTGTFAFLIEALLGVSSSDMDKDYELTSFTTNIDTDLHARRRDEEEWKSLMDQVDRYPGTIQRDKVLHWALEKGVSLDKINEFRTAMIDGNPEPLTDN